MNLKEYETIKFELAEQLRTLERLAGAGRTAIEDKIRALFARLAEDRFNLVVVGRFNRGKTSLMNALLGTDRLPTGILPLTSVITTVVYGNPERVLIRYEGRRTESEVSLSDLPDYITQQRNPGNVRRVEVAEVQLPQEILRRGFHFVDTPGLGSHIAENTQTTKRFLPQADAFVVVTSYESPVSEEELAVLRAASASFRRVFVVLNKHDTVSDGERESVQLYVREHLREVFGDHGPAVYSVSALDGIEARRSGDVAGLDASGIPALESALTEFMLDEKRTVFLLGMCERITDLAASLPDSPELGAFLESVSTKEAQIGKRNRRQGNLPPVSFRPAPRRPDNCEICRKIQTATFERLASYQHELATSFEVQKQHAQQRGLCRMHTRQYASLASPHDVCVGSAQLIEGFSAELAELARTIDRTDDRKPPPACLTVSRIHCALCLSAAHAEMQAVSALVHDLVAGGDGAVSHLSLICIPHIARVLPALREERLARAFLVHEAALLDRLAEDMRRYATKHDAIRRYLASQEEQDASETALAVLAGLPNGHVSDGWS
ncbi:dynamin family protein [Paraburkholderia terrae]|uniref:dynamin family protein n=1 Tax=Paraburkholderia terrae TaxID=311230 RepID=UPI00296AEBE1|nr:dynamin family protein [Paraburkholderia terrae]MDW3660670.1 dynamin family protein [Paraburkholderia terrae]